MPINSVALANTFNEFRTTVNEVITTVNGVSGGSGVINANTLIGGTVTANNLTSGRVTLVTTAGQLTDDSTLTYDTATDILTLAGTTDASSSTTGTLKVAGGLGVAKKLYVGTDLAVTGNTTLSTNLTVTGNATITGDLTVSGTTTTINSTTLTVDDINIELGSTASPTDVTAVGGGITLKGATDKTISWSATNGWTSSEDFNLVTGKVFKINGTSVLSSTTLGSGVTGSSLTSVGTLASLAVTGTLSGGTSGTGYSFSGSAPATSLTLDSSGNLGMAQAPSAFGYAGNITVPGGGRYIASTGDDIRFGANVYNDGSVEKYAASGNAEKYRLANGQHQFFTAASGTAGNAITFTQAMTLDASGNLGIGNSSPSSRLDVSGVISLQGTTLPSAGTARFFSRSSDSGLYIQSATGGTTYLLDGSQNTMYSVSPTSHLWAISNSTRMTLDSSGNLGIGTASPSTKLDVSGTITATGLTVSGNVSFTSTGALAIPSGTTGQQSGYTTVGMIRFNTTTDALEVYKSAGWASAGGSGATSSVRLFAAGIASGGQLF